MSEKELRKKNKGPTTKLDSDYNELDRVKYEMAILIEENESLQGELEKERSKNSYLKVKIKNLREKLKEEEVMNKILSDVA